MIVDTANLYAAKFPFLRIENYQAVFGGEAPTGATWHDRAMASAEIRIDREYWFQLGEPNELVVMFTTEEGFKYHMSDYGDVPPRVDESSK